MEAGVSRFSGGAGGAALGARELAGEEGFGAIVDM
jgi:hypothetical protein